MADSLYRRLNYAAQKINYDRGVYARVLITFPAERFADAPVWQPKGFKTAIDRLSWYRDNPDGTCTGITVVWTQDELEVWTVHFPANDNSLRDELWNKPHRVRWIVSEPEHYSDHTILERAPLATHPLGSVLEYWNRFYATWGFKPHLIDDNRQLGNGDYWLVNEIDPPHPRDPIDQLRRLSRTIGLLIKHFGARAQVFNWEMRRDDTSTDPRHIYIPDNPLILYRNAFSVSA